MSKDRVEEPGEEGTAASGPVIMEQGYMGSERVDAMQFLLQQQQQSGCCLGGGVAEDIMFSNHLLMNMDGTGFDATGSQDLVSMSTRAGASSPTAMAASSSATKAQHPSRYEAQKRRDWNTFGQYLKNQHPPLALAKCSSAHVLEFLRYLDQFGKTKVHVHACPFFGRPSPSPPPCPCPLRQAWGSLDALIGRLRAAFEEHGGKPESNPFGTRAVRLYLREVREMQAKARGIVFAKKKRKRPPPVTDRRPQVISVTHVSAPPDPCSSFHADN